MSFSSTVVTCSEYSRRTVSCDPRPIHAGSVVDVLTLGLGYFLQVLPFSPLSIFLYRRFIVIHLPFIPCEPATDSVARNLSLSLSAVK